MNQSLDEPANAATGKTQEIDFLNGSSHVPVSESSPPMNVQTNEFMSKIAREIEDEVRRKRAQGAFPPAFERRLKTIFEQLVPPGAGNSRRDFEALLRSSDRAAYFDIDVPIASHKPGVAKIKKLLRTTQAWYLNYLAQQLNNFSTNLMRLLYVFDSRVKKLEDLGESTIRVRQSGTFLKPYYVTSPGLDQKLLNSMGEPAGRVLIADCGNGYLVNHLKEHGFDSYGVDANLESLENPIATTLDLRWQDLEEHLKEIADDALFGIVLQNTTDMISPVEKLDLILQAKRVLAPTGNLAIISIDPHFFETSPELLVQRDLSSGRPFAPETWRYILEQLAFSNVSTTSFENCHLTIGYFNNNDAPGD
ncbi:MAG: hypothetical protein M0Z96_01390 [Actinomycetota bacterium]|nr:hypothetical protein [Actinomycetota bacterium]